jgi:hypothetical protein
MQVKKQRRTTDYQRRHSRTTTDVGRRCDGDVTMDETREWPMAGVIATLSATGATRAAHPMLYSSTILARNASSILSHLSRLPTELSTHPLLFTLSTNTPTASLSPLVTTLTSLSVSSSVGCLSSAAHPSAPIACSLAFFRKGHATPFYSDIPGRPETQVGRRHAMRKKGDEERVFGRE